MQAVYAAHLEKTYDQGVTALRDFNIDLGKGEVFGLLGPNGAGKTTTVRLLNGTLRPTSGEARIFGSPANAEVTRARTATLAELANIYEHLSATANLEFYAAMYDMKPSVTNRRIPDLIKRMGLEGREHDRVSSYSTGMKKRLQLARILMHEPELIFLDEPTSGLDPEAAAEVTDLIRSLSEDEGTTVVLCTHNLPVAEKVCDTFGFLSEGRLVATGNRKSLLEGIGWKGSVEVTTNEGREMIEIASEDEINGHLQRIMAAGRSIREVKLNEPDLEHLYFAYVGRKKHE